MKKVRAFYDKKECYIYVEINDEIVAIDTTHSIYSVDDFPDDEKRLILNFFNPDLDSNKLPI